MVNNKFSATSAWLFLTSATLALTACGGQLPIYHRAFQSPPPEMCRALDFGPGVSEYGAPITLTERERAWLKQIQGSTPDGVKLSPRLTRLAMLMLEAHYRGCDTDDPELQGDLYAHVGLYAHTNQMRASGYFTQAHPDSISPKALSMLADVDDQHSPLSVGVAIKTSWSVGSAAHLLKYRAEIELEPSPRFIEGSVNYRGRVLGDRIAQGLFVTLPDGSVQRCSFQRESKGEGSLIKCRRHPEDYQMIDATFTCGAPGRYQIEFTRDHRDLGPLPIANFRVWCGERPPQVLNGQPKVRASEVESVKRSEADLVQWVNQARARAGRAGLTYDAKLSDVARAYSSLRMQLKCGGHRCGGTTLRERISRLGLESLNSFENISNSDSPRRAHLGLMDSPAHRFATFSKEVTRYGVGVAVYEPKHKGELPFYYVTELYQSKRLERTAESCERYLREKLMTELPSVEYSSEYAASARVLVDEHAELSEISPETKKRVTRGGERLAYRYYKAGLPSYGAVSAPGLAEAMRREGATRFGVGCSRSTRGNQERWFVLVRYEPSPVNQARCESYLTQSLRAQIPHLKPSDKLSQTGREIAEMLSREPSATSREIKSFAKSVGVHYAYFKNKSKPMFINTSDALRSIKKSSASEVAVTCVEGSKKGAWQVVVTYNEETPSPEECRAFLRDEVQRRFKRVKPTLKMTQVSAEIARVISAPELDKTGRRQAVKARFKEPKHYTSWNHVKRPQSIHLDRYIKRLRGFHATEFGVTCRDNAPDDPERDDWSVVIHHNQSEMSERTCESYLTDSIKEARPKLTLNPRMAQVSNKIASILVNRSLTEAAREAQIQSAYPEETRHLKWMNVVPRLIPMKRLLSVIKEHGATDFALTCSKYREEDEQRWAIVVHYR